MTDRFAEGSFTRKEKIGKGAFGEVVVASCGSKEFALKQVRVPVESAGFSRDVSDEASIQMSFNHPNIAKCVNARYNSNGTEFLMFVELAHYGDLHRFVKKCLQAVHSKGYAHRDIKPHNILLFETKEAKIADFGSAKPMNRENMVDRYGGTIYYQPPEINDNDDLIDGIAWDLWGAAMVYVFCLLGRHPWGESDFADPQYTAFQQGDFQKLVKMDERWLRTEQDFGYLRQLMHHDPGTRIRPRCYVS